MAEHLLDGAIPADVAREQQQELSTALLDVQYRLRRLPEDDAAGLAVLHQFLSVANVAADAYRAAEGDGAVRRMLNQALFEPFEVDVDADGLPQLHASEAPAYYAVRAAGT